MRITYHDWGRVQILYKDEKNYVKIIETKGEQTSRSLGPFKTLRIIHFLLEGEMYYFLNNVEHYECVDPSKPAPIEYILSPGDIGKVILGKGSKLLEVKIPL